MPAKRGQFSREFKAEAVRCARPPVEVAFTSFRIYHRRARLRIVHLFFVTADVTAKADYADSRRHAGTRAAGRLAFSPSQEVEATSPRDSDAYSISLRA